MVDLFERDKSLISRHIINIFKEEELNQISVVAKNATTATDGKTYMVDYYNLDVIISVGYLFPTKIPNPIWLLRSSCPYPRWVRM
jgi:hypothetical protein